jgi:hypothetical protein
VTPFLTTANSGSTTQTIPNRDPARLVPNYAANPTSAASPSTDNYGGNNHLEANKDFLDYGKLLKQRRLILGEEKKLTAL